MIAHDIVENVIRLHQMFGRSKRIKKFMKNELNVELPKLSPEQKKEIKKVWNGIKVDYSFFRFFNLFNEPGSSWSPYYIPSNLHYSLIDMFYTDYKRCRTIEDKNLNDLLFYDVKQPKTIARKIDGFLLNKDFKALDVSSLPSLFTSANRGYLIKPSIDSGGGRKIMVWKAEDKIPISVFVKEIESYKDCIIQEFASQHDSISSLHHKSLNTIRIITFFHKGEVIPLSTIMRMGVGGSNIDNASVGGIFIGINDTGHLKNVAYNDYGDKFYFHPSTNEAFSDHAIPNYDQLIKLVKGLHNRLVGFSKLISWDFAIDTEGDPILIEVNATHGGISFHQMCNGPLFGNITEDVIKEVFTPRNRLLSHFL